MFLLKIKIKIQAAQIKNKNVVFKPFHQNIRPIWINDWDNMGYWEESGLETAFPALKLAENCCLNMNIDFS